MGERRLALSLTLCLALFGVPARCFIDLWSDWAVCVSRWLRRLPLSPDTLSGRVLLLYDSQSPALDQEELGLQKQGSQAHINKPSNPVLFHRSWGLWPQGKDSPGLWGQAAAATLKEHSFPEGTELSGFILRPCRNYTLREARRQKSHSSTALASGRAAQIHFLPPQSGVLLSCLSGDAPEVDHPSFVPT